MKKSMVILCAVLLVFGVVGVANAVPFGELVASYDFSGNANDTSGNNYDGSVHGATLTTDRFGNANSAYSFDGINDYIFIDAFEGLDIKYGTITLWAQSDIISTNREKHLIGKKGPGDAFGLHLKKDYNTMKATIRLEGAEFDSKTMLSNDVIDTEWHYYEITYDGINFSFYVDDVLQNTRCLPGEITTVDYFSGYYIGYKGVSLPYNFWNGQIDEIKIYSSLNPVPEPTTMLLLGSGLIGLAGFRRKFKK